MTQGLWTPATRLPSWVCLKDAFHLLFLCGYPEITRAKGSFRSLKLKNAGHIPSSHLHLQLLPLLIHFSLMGWSWEKSAVPCGTSTLAAQQSPPEPSGNCLTIGGRAVIEKTAWHLSLVSLPIYPLHPTLYLPPKLQSSPFQFLECNNHFLSVP